MRRLHAMPFGAVPGPAQEGARFGLWAPAAGRVEVVLDEAGGARRVPLDPVEDGWFAGAVPGVPPGARYRYAIDGGALVPDPASRFQPEGAEGPSELVDPAAFDWPDADWRGRPFEETVLYELHVGAFDPAGDYAGVARRLDHLVSLGVTAIELMPVADCPGARNWGYDGVLPFAPASRYGRPEDLKALVAAAHARGLMVFLDVVYNHFGPAGNHLRAYAPDFFTSRYDTPWGDAIDFESPASRPVRDFFVENALYWLHEYHLDGLRLDAVHAIRDASRPDVLEELAARVHERVGAERHVHLVLENDLNAAHRLLREPSGRPRQYTAQWNDDLHHALHVTLTGEDAGYYADYADDPLGRLGRCLAEGFAYQGEASRHRGGAPRGEPSAALPPTAFVGFLQNHDQVGNRAFGERIGHLAPAEAVRAAVHVLLLSPAPPLLFMGEEWAAPEPFLFFCDFPGELADAVREGRRREFERFPAFRDPAARERIPDPGDPRTFERCRLDWSARDRAPHADMLAHYRRLLAIRSRTLVPRLGGLATGTGRFHSFGRGGLRVDWTLADGATLVLVANLCDDAAPEAPLPVANGSAAAPLATTPPDLAGRLGAAFAAGGLPAWSAASWLGAVG